MQALRPGLLRLARRIGTWLIKRLAKWVATKLIVYMQLRIDDWKQRKVQPKGRIRRWTAAIAWLRSKLPALLKVAGTEMDALADHAEHKLGIPDVAPEPA